jgi:hypothetical protein
MPHPVFTMNTRSNADGSEPCYVVWYCKEIVATFPVNDPSSNQARAYAEMFVREANAAFLPIQIGVQR